VRCRNADTGGVDFDSDGKLFPKWDRLKEIWKTLTGRKDSLAGWTGSTGWPHRQTCCLGRTGRLAGTAAKISKRENQGRTRKELAGQTFGKYDRQVGLEGQAYRMAVETGTMDRQESN
jgi:hypothetical protein